MDFKSKYVIEAFIGGEWKRVSTGVFSILANAESVVKLHYKKKYKKVQITEIWV